MTETKVSYWPRASECASDELFSDETNEVIRWLRNNGCNWNKLNHCYASEEDHLYVRKWLKDKVCPWDQWTCYLAVKACRPEIV